MRLNRWIVLAVVCSACSGELTLSQTEQKVLNFSDQMMGSTMVGTPLTSSPIVIGPQNQTDYDTIMSITRGGGCSQFTVNAPGLPQAVFCDDGTRFSGFTYGGGSCVPINYTFTVTFTPQVAGPQTCTLTIAYQPSPTSTGGMGNTIRFAQMMVQATGIGTQYGLSVTPASVDLTDVRINTTSQQAVKVVNTGTTAVTVDGVFMQSAPNVFAVDTATDIVPPRTIQAGATSTYSVACTPPAAATYSGMLTFTSTPGNIARSVELRCNGVEANIYLSPTPANFDRDTIVGTPPDDISVRLHNDTALTISISSISLEDVGSEVTVLTQPPYPSIPAGGSLPISLHYAATREQAFGRIDRLTINAGGVARKVVVNGEALTGELGVAPSAVDFGPVCAGVMRSAEVQLYTTASAPVQITSIVQPASPFSAVGTGLMLEGNHGSIGTVTATVAAMEPGELDDKLTLKTNIPSQPMQDITLHATVLPPGVSPTPSEVHFGPALVGTLTSAKMVVISNCDTGTHAITSARIEGEAAAEFTIVSPADPAQALAVAGKLEFLVVMNPASTGTKAAQLVVELDDGSTVMAALDGNGFTGSSDDDGKQVTYYTCSAGDGLAGLPVGLALLALARRRRRAR